MKKSDLKTGDIVTMRNGGRAIVLLGVDRTEFKGDCIVSISERGWQNLDSYNEDLTIISRFEEDMEFDIVYVNVMNHPCMLSRIFAKSNDVTDSD